MESSYGSSGPYSKSNSELEASYDRVADKYADEFFHELERKPFDRNLLDAFAGSVRARGEERRIPDF